MLNVICKQEVVQFTTSCQIYHLCIYIYTYVHADGINKDRQTVTCTDWGRCDYLSTYIRTHLFVYISIKFGVYLKTKYTD